MSKYLCGWCAGSANSTMDAAWCHAKCSGPCRCAEGGHELTREIVAAIASYSNRTPEQVLERHGVEQHEQSDLMPETPDERRKRQKREANQRFKERHANA